MDNIIAESETTMINSLNFGLPETAQYITDRRHVNYFPSGSNVYSSKAGNKNIRFHITGEDNTYIDLSSIRLFANLQNTDGTRSHFLRPLSIFHPSSVVTDALLEVSKFRILLNTIDIVNCIILLKVKMPEIWTI